MGVEVAAIAAIVGGVIGGVSSVASGVSQREQARAQGEYEQEMLSYQQEQQELRWEQAKEEAGDKADEIERQAAHMKEVVAQSKELGLQSVGVGYEQLFGAQEQAEHQYGEMLQGTAEAESAMAAQAGASGLRNTGSVERVQDYQSGKNQAALEQTREQIDLQSDVSAEQLGARKEGVLNTYDDAMWQANEAETQAQNIREDYSAEGINYQLYQNTMSSLETQNNFLDEQIKQNQDTFWNVAGDALTGIAGGAQSGYQIYSGFKSAGIGQPSYSKSYNTQGQYQRWQRYNAQPN